MSARDIVQAKIAEISRLLEKREVEGIVRHYATHDPRFSAFEDSPPYTRMDGKRFSSFLFEVLSKASDIINEKYDIDVHVFGETALATGYERWSMTYDNEPVRGTARFTMLFIRIGDEWKVIHEHFTNVPSSTLT